MNEKFALHCNARLRNHNSQQLGGDYYTMTRNLKLEPHSTPLSPHHDQGKSDRSCLRCVSSADDMESRCASFPIWHHCVVFRFRFHWTFLYLSVWLCVCVCIVEICVAQINVTYATTTLCDYQNSTSKAIHIGTKLLLVYHSFIL